MKVDGSSALSVTVEFEKISVDDIKMTSTLSCPAPEFFDDPTRCSCAKIIFMLPFSHFCNGLNHSQVGRQEFL